ncbi:MAG: AAA family ATPase [Bacteroidales bacterium]|nr:AAA family ATPase [Bacteroidales bacterium]
MEKDRTILIRAYESHLLNRIITDNKLYFSKADQINERLFFTIEARELFGTFKNLIAENKVTDEALILSRLNNGSSDYFIKSAMSVDYGIPIDQLISELEEHNRHTELLMLAGEVIRMKEKPSAEIQQYISEKFLNLNTGNGNQYRNISEIVEQVVSDIMKIREGKMTGILTGFQDIDRHMKGLQNGDLIIIAGETSQGKTSLALNIAENAYLIDNKRAAIISMEMTESQLAMRLICSMSETSRNEIIRGWVAPEEMQKFEHYKNKLAESGLFIADPTSRTIENIISLIRSAFMRFSLDFVIVDYLQLISGNGRNREEEVGKVSRALKDIARELNKPVICLSQLNRPAQGVSKRPTLARLRDSGQIEESADVVLFVYRPEEYGVTTMEDNTPSEGMAELIMAKGRNCGTMMTKVRFIKNITKFKDVETGTYNGKPTAGLNPNKNFEGSNTDDTPF